jgi:hypothetical protein
MKTGIVILMMLILAARSFSQSDIDTQCVNSCISTCTTSCQGSADPGTCGYNCGADCINKCGGNLNTGVGITNPDQCTGVTTSDGYATVWDGTGCVDPNAAEHYCEKALTCNDCQATYAYPCIWNGACVPCTTGDCTYSCGGGNGGGNNNGGTNNGANNNGANDNNGGNGNNNNSINNGGTNNNGGNAEPVGGCCGPTAAILLVLGAVSSGKFNKK